MKINQNIQDSLMKYGSDIIRSHGMQMEKKFMQHGTTSVYEHSVAVACFSLMLCRKLGFKVNEREMVRGALLHDYFLYDWHDPDPSHRLHGFFHARTALKNADRDFSLTSREKDIIEKHMFPLNIRIPKYRESVIVCIADKICAIQEMVTVHTVSTYSGNWQRIR